MNSFVERLSMANDSLIHLRFNFASCKNGICRNSVGEERNHLRNIFSFLLVYLSIVPLRFRLCTSGLKPLRFFTRKGKTRAGKRDWVFQNDSLHWRYFFRHCARSKDYSWNSDEVESAVERIGFDFLVLKIGLQHPWVLQSLHNGLYLDDFRRICGILILNWSIVEPCRDFNHWIWLWIKNIFCNFRF